MEEFGRMPMIGLSQTHLVLATGDLFEVELIPLDGGQRRLVRRNSTREEISEQELRVSFDAQLARTAEQFRKRLLRSLHSMEWPKYHPAIEDLLVDASDRIWIKGRRDWWVINQEGESLAYVEMPEGFRPTDVYGNDVLGVQEDDLGAQTLALYRIDNGGGEVQH